MVKNVHYFDHNATTPLSAVAETAWLRASREYWQNPSSLSRASARVRNLLEACRERLAGLLGTRAEEIVFTGGATEGNNAVIAWAGQRAGATGRIAVSSLEHASVREAARHHFGERVDWLPATPHGVIDLEALRAYLMEQRPTLLCLMAANNETGALQPWKEATSMAHANGVPVLVDAAQWIGRLGAEALGACDFVTGCAHKFGGPRGVGFLKFGEVAADLAVLHGGGQEHGHRGGTENYPAIAAMLAALEEALDGLGAVADGQEGYRNAFEQTLLHHLPGVAVLGATVERLWNTSLLVVPGPDHTRWVTHLDRRGFVVSPGAACAASRGATSSALAAMGLGPEQLRQVLRISSSRSTTEADWQHLASAILELADEFSREAHTPSPWGVTVTAPSNQGTLVA